MKGLHKVPTGTHNIGIGILVVDCIFSCVIVAATATAIHICPPAWKRVQTIHFGMILLCIWTVLNWIDLTIRSTSATVTYSYILFSAFSDIFRITSAIFVLWGMMALIIRYNHLRGQNFHNQLWFFEIPLWTIGIYFLCLQLGTCFAWLDFADLESIQRLAKARNGFAIAFEAVQFVLYILVAGGALSVKTRSLTKVRDKTHPFLIWTCLALLARSFCELIFVGQLDRSPKNLRIIWRARMVLFHLCSAVFALNMALTILHDKKSIERDKLHFAETEAIKAVQRRIQKELTPLSKSRKPAIAPAMKDLLKKAEGEEPNIYTKAEIKRLMKRYGDWTPINKTGQEMAT